jgi:HEAT repeat protein
MEPDRIADLVQLLTDRSARLDARDDAAIDLGGSDDPRAIDALIEVGSDPDEDKGISATCGEWLAHIASRGGENAKRWLLVLSHEAAAEYRRSLDALRPGLLD